MNLAVLARPRHIDLGFPELPPLEDVSLELPHGGLLIHKSQSLACGKRHSRPRNAT